MLNRITIMGRLCSSPELRRTQSGVSVCTVTIACDRDYMQNGERQTDFIDVVAWRGTAEFLCNYFGKGRMIVVDGQLQSRKWTDKEGNKRINWEVQASNLYFADSKREDSSNTVNEAEATPPAPMAANEEDGELPF